MTQGFQYTIIDTQAGWLGVASSSSGLCRIVLPQTSFEQAVNDICRGLNGIVFNRVPFRNLARRLSGYFTGYHVDFPDGLDLAGASDFQRRVWEAARSIPYGETRSYAWVAEAIGKPTSVRAVGQALGKNPLPIIIPCHRVIAAGGRLGGFTGGLKMKRLLLDLEKGEGTF